ncbi:MAG: bifunctional DNA-formamidopyrimidine glycosylase/DNA-(apurinic or apyrimidinic site) lyase [Thermomicrobiales bacterium]
MPELPEVETVRRILEQETVGRQITCVTFHDFHGVIGDMDPDTFQALVRGQTLGCPQRRGKYLSIPLSEGLALVIHLRMTGRLLVLPNDAAPVRFEHLALHLDSGQDLRFADQRKFGRVLCLDAYSARAALARLGPEPLERRFSASYLAQMASRRTAPVKNVLLDQRIVAGLGNIYVDEALFRARINPFTPAGTLTQDDHRRLVRAIRYVLRAALLNQGTTFSSFENPYGEQGRNADFLQVYGKGKAGQRCGRCDNELAWTKLGGRGTSFCPTCQPMPTQ